MLLSAFNDRNKPGNNGKINLIPKLPESPNDNKISLCDATKAAFCCFTPNVEKGKVIRNCLCCTTWTVLTLGGTTAVAGTFHAVKTAEIFGALFVTSVVCETCLCCSVIKV